MTQCRANIEPFAMQTTDDALIAKRLGGGIERTVANIVASVFRKIGVSGRPEFIATLRDRV